MNHSAPEPQKRDQGIGRIPLRVKCVGHKKDGSACGKWAIRGTTVCRVHGGAAPQVKEAARLRLAALVSPAIAKLKTVLDSKKNDQHVPIHTQVLVARDVLDRNGFKPKDEFIVSAEFDVGMFSNMSDGEIRQLVVLARKASTLKEASDTEE